MQAKRGNAFAIGMLERRDFPEEIDYLKGWFDELRRTRAYDMNGPIPFSYPMIESWARLTGREVDAEQVEALLVLDMASRAPVDDPPATTEDG